jgi:O-acetyl-ADP-ribose deacetylase (regulator of RNase III)
MTFYEQKKRDILAAPFSSIQDKAKYEMPLREWCRHHSHRLPIPSTVSLHDLLSSASDRDTLRLPTRTLVTFRAHIETLLCTAIVNAANESLLGGGGIDFAIHNAAGPLLLRECATFAEGCDVGAAVITKGYDLPSAVVIHTVGPILKEDGEPDDEALAKCYASCLQLCDVNEIEDVVFPGISTGFYGFPWPRATKVAVDSVVRYFERTPSSCVKFVGFCGFEGSHVEMFRDAFGGINAGTG